jgi:hypothetical protein
MSFVRWCLGCSATYPPDGHACPECGSHAGHVEEDTPAEAPAASAAAEAKPKPARRPGRPRKT